MSFLHRSYTSGQFFRPKPYVLERPESNLIVVATPWGPLEHAQRVAEIVTEQFELLSREDLTTPFESIPTLNSAANRLRMGLMTANQFLFKGENAKAWKTAVEIVAIHYDKPVLSWAHVGGPHLLLADSKFTHPLAYVLDWDAQTQIQGPLFSQALGIEAQLPISAGSVRVNKGSRLLMLSRSHWPRGILSNPFGKGSSEQEMDLILKSLVEENSENPFWLGLFDPAA